MSEALVFLLVAWLVSMVMFAWSVLYQLIRIRRAVQATAGNTRLLADDGTGPVRWPR